MQIALKRDLVFLDLESTGLHILKDRIVQLACIKYFKAGKAPVEKMWYINPGIPISEEAMAIHGLTPELLRNKPTFSQVAQEVWDFIGDADLGGYNCIRFDIPMLMEEFSRVGLEFDIEKRHLIDVQRIFYKMEPRTLRAALRYYRQEEIEDAHDALADVRATVKVLEGQLDMYENKDLLDEDGSWIEKPIQRDVKVLHEFTNDMRIIDPTQKIKLDHQGVVVFNFGVHNGKPVGETLAKDKQYLAWILEKEFSSQVKQIVKREVKAYKDKHS